MRRMLRRRVFLAVVPALALFLGTREAAAAPLLPGQSGVVIDGIVPSGLEVLLTSTTQAIVSSLGAADWTGTVFAAVLDEGAANPLGGLTFAYQITNDALSTHALRVSTESNFGGWDTDVHFTLLGSLLGGGFFADGTEQPLTASRSLDGEVVGFSWESLDELSKIGPGETSLVFLIRTNAPDWTAGFTSAINGGVDTVPTFQPADAVVPEAPTLLLFGTGLMGLGIALKRRTARQL